MPAQFSIERNDFCPPSRAVAGLLASLAEYQAVPAWPRDSQVLAEALTNSDPFTIILFAEPLASEHWRRQTHTVMRRIERLSEIDETIYRHFDRELNMRMADWLRNHADPDDTHLRTLVRERYPEARRILRAEYQERYPRTWRQRWAKRGYVRPRREIECHRRYDLPAPLGLWQTAVPQQFYFLRQSRTYARGCSTSSGSREIHSFFGLAFLELTRRGVRIPSHILVYDCHNRLLVVDSLPSFALIPGAMGSNCSEPANTVRNLMQTALTVCATERGEYSVIVLRQR